MVLILQKPDIRYMQKPNIPQLKLEYFQYHMIINGLAMLPDTHGSEIHLTPEQIAEIERRMSDEEPFATDEEVRSMFARLTK
jgi:hypothetical protein